MYLHTTLRRPTTLTFGTNCLIGFSAIATGILSARLLGPIGKGELTAIQIWPATLSSVAGLGLSDALVYFSARDPKRSRSFLITSLLISFTAGLILIPVGFWLIPHLLSTQSNATIKAGQTYLLLIPILCLAGLPFQSIRGLNRFLTWNCLRLGPSVSWLLVLVAAAFLHQKTPAAIARGHLFGLTLLITPVLSVSIYLSRGSFMPEAQSAKHLLKFGLPCVLSGFSQLLNSRFDQMLMAGLLEPRELGAYATAVAWSSMIQPAMSAIGSVLFPRVARLYSRHDQVNLIILSLREAACVGLLLGGALLLLTPFAFTRVFGSAFISGLPMAEILVIAAVITGYNLVLEEGLRGLNRPRSVFCAEVIGAVVTIISVILLVPRMKGVGASLASLISYSTVTLVLLFCLRTDSSLFRLMPGRADLWALKNKLVSTAALQ